MHIADANMNWDCFDCLICCQNRENTAFHLILRSALELLSQVDRSSSPCQKRSKVCGTEMAEISASEPSVGNWKNYEKHVQCSKDKVEMYRYKILPIYILY